MIGTLSVLLVIAVLCLFSTAWAGEGNKFATDDFTFDSPFYGPS